MKKRAAGQPWKGPFAAGSLLWAPDGKTLVTTGRSGKVQVWNVEKGKVERELRVHRQQGGLALAWHGKALAVGTGNPRGGSGGEVRLWDLVTGEPLGAGLPLPGAAMSLAALPDGRLAIGVWGRLRGRLGAAERVTPAR